MPFTFDAVEPFRVTNVIPREHGDARDWRARRGAGWQPTRHRDRPRPSPRPLMGDEARVAVELLKNTGGYREAVITAQGPATFAGGAGYVVTAVVEDRTVVQYLRIVPGGAYLRFLARGQTSAMQSRRGRRSRRSPSPSSRTSSRSLKGSSDCRHDGPPTAVYRAKHAYPRLHRQGPRGAHGLDFGRGSASARSSRSWASRSSTAMTVEPSLLPQHGRLVRPAAVSLGCRRANGDRSRVKRARPRAARCSWSRSAPTGARTASTLHDNLHATDTRAYVEKHFEVVADRRRRLEEERRRAARPRDRRQRHSARGVLLADAASSWATRSPAS